MKRRKAYLILAGIILLFPIAGLCFYPFMPERMATHWGFGTEPDGYMDKFAGTFITLLIMGMSIAPAIAYLIGFALAKVYDNEKFENWWYSFVIMLLLFLFYAYLLILLWNAGIKVNVPLFLMAGGITLICLMIAATVYFYSGKTSSAISRQSKEYPIFSDGVYRDKLVEIDNEAILFRWYYFPVGAKKVKFSEVEYVLEKEPTVWNGRWKLHGGGFTMWFPADFDRPSRDKIFLMKLKKKWIRIGFTVENSQAVAEFFQAKGLLRLK